MPTQKASRPALASAKVFSFLITKTFLFDFHGRNQGAGPRCQGSLEESVVAFLGQSGDLTDSSLVPSSFGILGNCEAITTVLRPFSPDLSHPTRMVI